MPRKRRPIAARGLRGTVVFPLVRRSSCLRFSLIGWVVACLAGGAVARTAEPLVEAKLQHSGLTESSGLAFSRRNPQRVWTHNDSGGTPQLFAFDLHGRSTAVYQVTGAKAIDWEDLAAFSVGGQAWLLVADVGDNQRRRTDPTLYLLREPDPDRSGRVAVDQVIRFAYPDGPHDCEAVAVDARRRQILLVTKAWLPLAGVYSLPLDLPPRSGSASVAAARATLQRGPLAAKRLGRIPLPLITAMDVTADGEQLLLVDYFNAWIYRPSPAGSTETPERPPREPPWERLLEMQPTAQALPHLPQIEAACFGPQSRVWVTSEGHPAPLVRLPPSPPPGAQP